jgi:hypothetical protein
MAILEANIASRVTAGMRSTTVVEMTYAGRSVRKLSAAVYLTLISHLISPLASGTVVHLSLMIKQNELYGARIPQNCSPESPDHID